MSTNEVYRKFLLMNSISYAGWGIGSRSFNLYQVHLEYLNQSECRNVIGQFPEDFDPEQKICAGNLEPGEERGPCEVSH